MEHIKELMAEYMALASKQDAKSKERRDEIHRYLSANATEEDKKYISEVVVDRVANLKLEVASLREQACRGRLQVASTSLHRTEILR